MEFIAEVLRLFFGMLLTPELWVFFIIKFGIIFTFRTIAILAQTRKP